MPFALLSLLLFFCFERTRRGWLLLLGIAAVAMIFLVWIPFNWHGGGGFVGNRYFLMVYPAFLFLVGRIQPAASVAVFWALGGWLVGPLVLAPFGLAVPSPTLQWHVRNAALKPFPIEFSLRAVPGYSGAVHSETWVWGRKDHLRVLENGEIDRAWLRGGGPLDLWLYRGAPLGEHVALEMKAPFEGQTAVVRLGGVERRVTLGTEWTRLEFEHPRIYKLRRERLTTAYHEFSNIWIYRLQVDLERGRYPAWDDQSGPYFYLGAELKFLGEVPGMAQSP
jgi:hypothetical protein